MFRDLIACKGTKFADIAAAGAALKDRQDCNGKVGIFGFCSGGGFALLMAAGHGFSASSINYGLVPENVADRLAGACPVVGSFGARDPTMKGAAQRLERALRSADIDHDVKEYPNVSHAFMERHEVVLGFMLDRFGFRYDETAARDARTPHPRLLQPPSRGRRIADDG